MTVNYFSFLSRFYYMLSFWAMFLFIITNTYAQNHLQGLVVDSQTKQPLAFAHLIINGNDGGLMTDIDGAFTISETNVRFLRCSYVGYKTKDYIIDPLQKIQVIALEVDENELELVELVAKENPAHRIIREVIKNKSTHNPEYLKAFSYQCYNKMIYDFEYGDSKHADSLKLERDLVLEGGYMLMSESITNRKYLSPEYTEETILATRFSGFKNPSFTSLATDLQPFSFYKDIIPFLDAHYLNPISTGSLKKYQFYIRETILNTADTTFIIEYYPIKGRNIEGLKGLLYINSDGYALENVIAEPYETGKINLKIQQKYTKLKSGQWFPEQLNFVLRFKEYPSKHVQISVNGKSYISDVNLDVNYKPKDFSIDQVKMSPLATTQNADFWKEHRSIKLNNKEEQTYQVIDSLGEKYNVDTYMKLSENLMSGKIKSKYYEFDVSDALAVNLHEGFRLGLGIYTGDSISTTIKFGGYFAYGFTDKKAKHGVSLAIKLNEDKESELKLQYRNDVQEFGTFHNRNLGSSKFSQRQLIISEMNQFKHFGFTWNTRSLKYLQSELSIAQNEFTPQYTYLYKNENLNPLKVSSLGVNLRFAYKEKFIQTLHKRMSMGTKYPVLSAVFKTADTDLLNSEYAFTSLKLKAEYNTFWKNIGKTHVTLEVGKVFNELPAPLLFSGEGSFDDRVKLFTPQVFQTAKPYEFLSNQFAHLFLRHNFGSLLFKTEKFKPQFSLVHNMGWSTLINAGDHKFKEEKKDMSKGFIESGLIVDNIIRFNYLDVGYLGLGVGFFGRYGAYAFDKTSDNILYKVSFIFTTR